MWSALQFGVEDMSKRWRTIGIVLIGVVLMSFAAATYTVTAQGPSGNPVTDWEGGTSQGLPMSFVIEEGVGGSLLTEYHFDFDLHCLTTGRIQRIGLGVTINPGIDVDQGSWNDRRLSPLGDIGRSGSALMSKP